MFDNIAPEYDRLNHIMSLDIDRSWRRRALRQIFSPTAAEKAAADRDASCGEHPLRVLDVACGTGDFSIAVAKEMIRRSASCSCPGSTGDAGKSGEAGNAGAAGNAAGSVTGLDLSEGMLKIMEKKICDEGLDGIITCRTGDCEALDFPDGTFDRVTVAFGVRNFEDREKGLREMLRVLKPGGKLVILELSVPSNALIRWLFNLYFLHILPLVGGKVSGDKAAYRYLPASVLNFPDKKAFTHTLRNCGYSHVTHKAFTLGICRMYTGEKSEYSAKID